MKSLPQSKMPFLGDTDLKHPSWDKARVVILPLPYEKTVSYGKGTAGGPEAILKASEQVELFDEELVSEPYECGIYTAEKMDFGSLGGRDAINRIKDSAGVTIGAGKFLIGLGGEHTVTTGLVMAHIEKYRDLHVVHLDAHADMREELDGNEWSHACVMNKISRLGIPYTSIGIRALCKEEFKLIKPNRKNYFFAHEVVKNAKWIDNALKTISGSVYLTLDVDVFDGSVIPHTGTPVPGGLTWYQVLDFLRALMKSKKVVGADVVELAPNKESRASDFAVARLVYKMIGYLMCKC